MANGSLEQAVRLSQAVKALLDDEPITNGSGVRPPTDFRWVIIGGLAASAWSRPRATQDVDVLVDTGTDASRAERALAPLFPGFDIHVMTASEIGLAPAFARCVFSTAVRMPLGGHRVPVASRDAVVALKLLRADHIDLADIERIVQAGGPVDLKPFRLPNRLLDLYREATGEEP